MARTRWPPGPVNPGLLPGQADQTGSAGGCHNLGPGRQIVSKDSPSAASADSEVRPGPRPPTLRSNRDTTREAGPEALPTSSLPTLYSAGCAAGRKAASAERPVIRPDGFGSAAYGAAYGVCPGWWLKVGGGLGRSGEHGIAPPGLVADAAVEGFAGCPANVAVVGAGIPQDFGGAGDQGGADSLSVPGRCHADASDAPRGGAKDGREYGIGTGPRSSRVPTMCPASSRAISTFCGPDWMNQRVQRGKVAASKASTSAGLALTGWVMVMPLFPARSLAPGGGRYRLRSVTRSRVSWLCCQPREVKNRTAPGRSRGTLSLEPLGPVGPSVPSTMMAT
jgi:hypothetical protein